MNTTSLLTTCLPFLAHHHFPTLSLLLFYSSSSKRIIFCTNSLLQEAAATGLELANDKHFFEDQRAAYAERRQILMDVFDKLGLEYTVPDGAYFLLVDISKCVLPPPLPPSF